MSTGWCAAAIASRSRSACRWDITTSNYRDGTQTQWLRVIIAPPRCYTPASLREGQRVWGLAAQLYGVRTQHNWGVGDFTDLRALVEFAAAEGAGVIAVNPLHALFLDNPAHDSPYSPSHRASLNALYIDIEALPDFAECAAARASVEATDFQAQLRYATRSLNVTV